MMKNRIQHFGIGMPKEKKLKMKCYLIVHSIHVWKQRKYLTTVEKWKYCKTNDTVDVKLKNKIKKKKNSQQHEHIWTIKMKNVEQEPPHNVNVCADVSVSRFAIVKKNLI